MVQGGTSHARLFLAHRQVAHLSSKDQVCFSSPVQKLCTRNPDFVVMNVIVLSKK